MIAAIYARVSKENCTECGHPQAKHTGGRGKCTFARGRKCSCEMFRGQDTANQLAELRVYCERQSWKVLEYIDHETGKHSDRDAFQRMFSDASRRKFDVVVVWALDRLSREGIFETLSHLKRLREFGIGFESYTEQQFRTTGPGGEAFAELMVALAAWMAKQERIRISERTKAGLATARRRGRIGGRPVRTFDRYRALELRRAGKSWREIGRELELPQSTVRAGLRGVQKTSPKKRRIRVEK